MTTSVPCGTRRGSTAAATCCRLEGEFADGAMTLRGRHLERGAPAKASLQRIRWTSQPDGRVRQLWEASENEGKDWKVVFDGWYTRRN